MVNSTNLYISITYWKNEKTIESAIWIINSEKFIVILIWNKNF